MSVGNLYADDLVIVTESLEELIREADIPEDKHGRKSDICATTVAIAFRISGPVSI